MFAYPQMSHGNLAVGIMAVTFLARLALLPLTLRVARALTAHQEAMRRLEPELEAIRARFEDDPTRIANETRRVLAREGVSIVPGMGCAGTLLQSPVLLALFGAVRQTASAGGRFLWIRDISRRDLVLALLVAAVTVASAAAGPRVDAPAQNRMLMFLLPAGVALVALVQMAAGVGLYWGVSRLVGAAQGLVLRYAAQRQTA